MSIDQFSLDVPKAIERISRDEKHETRRYSGVTILKEIALCSPSRYYHLITPVEQFFEQLFGIMTDPKVLKNKLPSLFYYFDFFSNIFAKHLLIQSMQHLLFLLIENVKNRKIIIMI
jgi:hypothetical protein